MNAPASGPATILELLARADRRSVAIEAEGSAPVTYGALADHVEATAATLSRLGVRRGERIALVLPAGPEVAASFLAIAAATSAAPLNPAYRREEFESYLADLRPRAVLTSADAGGAVHEAATSLDVPVLHVNPSDGAGLFDIEHVSGRLGRGGGGEPAEADDIALLLHTSGTTTRPKLVPLTQRNITLGAANVAKTLALTPDDRCLAVMPLFHIHGIVASLLATLSTGGTVIVTHGFNAFRAFEWLAAWKPTWLTAVPPMHQAILHRSAAHADILRTHSLRFVRSSSSALPPSLMRRLEAAFDVPALEAMGMTEASHQVASNPLPPGERRAGSVGPAAGPEIAVLDEDGDVQVTGSGELLVRGSNVMSGYERNDEANRASFVDGWFRTGDLGSIDSSGYARLTGRIKEMINRGGEKIGPREVEEVLLDHDGVDQVVVFPAPHRNLGEDVAAAVVLAPNADVDADDLRSFVRSRLAAFKVPRTLLIVDDIPSGPTGKPQRLTLARLFGLEEGR